jgi:lipoprotein-releasing system permease protein
LNVPFELHIAFRYLVAKRKQAFISVISFISTLGVTVGVMALVIALALMTGLMQEVAIGFLPPTRTSTSGSAAASPDYRAESDRLRQVPRVLGAAPAILDQTLIYAGGTSTPVQVKGIDPDVEQQVTDIRAAVRSGHLEDLRSSDERSAGILLGKTWRRSSTPRLATR